MTADPTGAHPVVRCRSPRAAVIVMCLTVGLVYGAGTILFTALEKVAEQLDANQTELQWVSGTYPF